MGPTRSDEDGPTEPSPYPPLRGATFPMSLAPAPRRCWIVVINTSDYKGGQHQRQAHDEQGAGTVLPTGAFLQGGRQGQAGGPRPSGQAREARGRPGRVALGGAARRGTQHNPQRV